MKTQMEIYQDQGREYRTRGNSYPHRDILKAAGFRFHSEDKDWYTRNPRIAAKLIAFCLPELQKGLQLQLIDENDAAETKAKFVLKGRQNQWDFMASRYDTETAEKHLGIRPV